MSSRYSKLNSVLKIFSEHNSVIPLTYKVRGLFIINCMRWNSCKWYKVAEKPHKPQENPGWTNFGSLKRIVKSPRSYLWCAYIWGCDSLPEKPIAQNEKAYLSVILPRSAVMSGAPACYQSLCLWSCLKLARSVFPSQPHATNGFQTFTHSNASVCKQA